MQPLHHYIDTEPKQANALAAQGQYVAGSIPSFAADTSLFVKAHAY